jgi:hypothetical protein
LEGLDGGDGGGGADGDGKRALVRLDPQRVDRREELERVVGLLDREADLHHQVDRRRLKLPLAAVELAVEADGVGDLELLGARPNHPVVPLRRLARAPHDALGEDAVGGALARKERRVVERVVEGDHAGLGEEALVDVQDDLIPARPHRRVPDRAVRPRRLRGRDALQLRALLLHRLQHPARLVDKVLLGELDDLVDDGECGRRRHRYRAAAHHDAGWPRRRA